MAHTVIHSVRCLFSFRGEGAKVECGYGGMSDERDWVHDVKFSKNQYNVFFKRWAGSPSNREASTNNAYN